MAATPQLCKCHHPQSWLLPHRTPLPPQPQKPSAEQVSQRREAENDRRRQAEESLLSQTGYLRAYPSGDMARDAEVERLMRVAEEIFQETDAVSGGMVVYM